MATANEQRTVKDLNFWYREAFDDPYTGSVLVREKIAQRGETITLTHPEDLRRGDEAGSFFTDEELDAGHHLNPANQFDTAAQPNPEVGDPNLVDESIVSDAAPTSGGVGDDVPDLANDSVDDIAAWVPNHNINEVLAVAGNYADDPDALNKLLDAEEQATGDESRKGLVDGVQKLLDAAGQ